MLCGDAVRACTSNSVATPIGQLPWGGDWTFSESAHIMFDNMDQIVKWTNAHSTELNATIRYGTLDNYLDIVHHAEPTATADPQQRTQPSNLTFPVVEGDFFANDDECCQQGLVKKVTCASCPHPQIDQTMQLQTEFWST